MSFFGGRQEQMQQVPTKTGGQMDLLSQILQSLGGGGQAGQGQQAALQNLIGMLTGSQESFQAFEEPARRGFREQTIPDILERFSGAGARSSSGLQQTLAGAGRGLESDLAQQRGGMQKNAVMQLLANFLGQSQLGLGTQTFENIQRPAQQGLGQTLLDFSGPGLQAVGAGIGGPIGAAAGTGISALLKKIFGNQYGTNNQ